ncbi:MAG: TCR/Tet family MFS transporter [Alphaproteobacteria bacterium]
MSATLHNSPAAFRFIFITVLLDMLALGIIVPVLPSLVSDFMEGDTAKAAMMIGLFGTVWAAMQFIFSPLLGVLSDRFGRRPVILLSCLGLGLDYILMALAPTIGWLLAGRVLSGITAANMSTANAYISDVTPADKRSKAYGLLSCAFGVGFIMGPAIGGWLGSTDPRLPFWCAAACCLLNTLYGCFVLPESLPPEKRQAKIQWKIANPAGAVALLKSDTRLACLAAINFIGYLAHEVYPTVFVLYTMHRYGWDESAIGTALAVVGVATIIISGGVVGIAVKKLGERGTLFAGLALGAAGFWLFGWASAGWMFLLAIPVNSLWGLAGAPTQTMMTQIVPATRQGELQGALGSLRSVAMLVGPGLFAAVYAGFLAGPNPMPGAPWYLAAAMLVVSLVVARLILQKPQPQEAVS